MTVPPPSTAADTPVISYSELSAVNSESPIFRVRAIKPFVAVFDFSSLDFASVQDDLTRYAQVTFPSELWTDFNDSNYGTHLLELMAYSRTFSSILFRCSMMASGSISTRGAGLGRGQPAGRSHAPGPGRGRREGLGQRFHPERSEGPFWINLRSLEMTGLTSSPYGRSWR